MAERVRQAAALVTLLGGGAAAWIGCDALAGIQQGELAPGLDASLDGTLPEAAAGDTASSGEAGDGGATLPCADGGLACDGGCVDPSKDPGNCGSCGAACASGFNCVASVCGNWVVDMVAGDSHTCARLSRGDYYCWGNDVEGELANDAGGTSSMPTLVAGDVNNNPFRGVLFMSAGMAHNCALRNGGLECWGSDVYGQLGNGQVSPDGGPFDDPVPTGVQTLGIGTGDVDHPTFLARGPEATHACAINEAGVVCWGDNSAGELGHPPPDAGSGEGGGAGDSGVDRVCTGTVPCAPIPSPVVPPLAGVAVAVGEFFSCAVDGAGAVWCWGKNSVGQLGNGTRFGGGGPPTRVVLGDGGTPAVSVAAGVGFACAVLADGTVWCWGNNISSQLGHDSGAAPDMCCNMPSCTPADYCATTASPVEGLTTAVSVEVGCAHACALGKNGAVFCWGSNSSGELGVGGGDTAKPVITFNDADGVTVGCRHTCAWKKGAAYCWGDNTQRQLGSGTVNSTLPLQVMGLP